MDLSKVLDVFKLTPKHFFAVALATGAVLLLPQQILERVGLFSARQTFLPWIGGLFLLSLAFLISHLVADALAGTKGRRAHKKRLKGQQLQLHSLSQREKQILRGYLEGASSTQNFRIGDGEIGGLAARGFVFRSSSIGNVFTGFAYNIQPWVLEYLRQHPEVLD